MAAATAAVSATSTRIVGVDPSLRCTGVAFTDGVTFSAERWRPPNDGPARLAWFRDRFAGALAPMGGLPTDLVVIEGYAYGARSQAHALGELGGVLRLCCHDLHVPYVVVPPTVLKKYVAGKGTAAKELMIREVYRRWGFEARDNNEADAYGLARFGCDWYFGTQTKAFAELRAKVALVGPGEAA